MRLSFQSLLFLAVFSTTTLSAWSQKDITVLVLTKSSGYEHAIIHRENGNLSFLESLLLEIGLHHNIQFTATKDAGMINAKQLQAFDVVMFYTSNDLRQPGEDHGTPMGEKGITELVEWVKNGGGFFASHTATATFQEEPAFQQLSGGIFDTHGQQEKAKIQVIDNLITKPLDKEFELLDEYYIFKDLHKTEHYQPLLILDTKSMKQEVYNQREPYPIAWTDRLDEGRIFNCALGHREEIWTNPQVQQFIINGIKWAAGVEFGIHLKENILQKIRNMSPEERRDFFLNLSPQEREKLRERFREKMDQRREQ